MHSLLFPQSPPSSQETLLNNRFRPAGLKYRLRGGRHFGQIEAGWWVPLVKSVRTEACEVKVRSSVDHERQLHAGLGPGKMFLRQGLEGSEIQFTAPKDGDFWYFEEIIRFGNKKVG